MDYQDVEQFSIEQLQGHLQDIKTAAATSVLVPIFETFREENFELGALLDAVTNATFQVYPEQSRVVGLLEKAVESARDFKPQKPDARPILSQHCHCHQLSKKNQP